MYALELLRGAVRDGDVGVLMRLALPASLKELVGERIAALPDRLGPLLEAVAALERPSLALLRVVVDDADALADEAVTANALAVDDRGSVRFTHPLLGAAVYGRVALGRRRALHARLAETVVDPEERGRHLALATEGSDSAVAELLMQAAQRAAARGAPDAAAALVGQARRLTPGAELSALSSRALAQAEYLADVGEFARARALLDELLAGDAEGTTRARALHLYYVMAPPPAFGEAIGLLEAALEHAPAEDPIRLRLAAWLAHAHGFEGDFALAERRAGEAVQLAKKAGDVELIAIAMDVVFDIGRARGTPRPPAFDELLGVERRGQLRGEPPPLVLLGRDRCAGRRPRCRPDAAGARDRGVRGSRRGVRAGPPPARTGRCRVPRR